VILTVLMDKMQTFESGWAVHRSGQQASCERSYAACNMQRVRVRRVVLIAVVSVVVLAWVWGVFWGVCVLLKRVGQDSAGIARMPPMSEDQAKAYLKDAEVKLARLPDGTPTGDHPELSTISTTVHDIAKDYPEMPGVWKVAGMAIDKRLGGTKGGANAVVCGTDPATVHRAGPTDRFQNSDFVTFQDCTIELDGLIHDNEEKTMPTPDKTREHVLQLHNVHVIYRGGPVPRMATFACDACTFDMQILQPPHGQARSLMRGVLELGSQNFSIEVLDE
jgi:hypothetical protein